MGMPGPSTHFPLRTWFLALCRQVIPGPPYSASRKSLVPWRFSAVTHGHWGAASALRAHFLSIQLADLMRPFHAEHRGWVRRPPVGQTPALKQGISPMSPGVAVRSDVDAGGIGRRQHGHGHPTRPLLTLGPAAVECLHRQMESGALTTLLRLTGAISSAHGRAARCSPRGHLPRRSRR
jgi:hypothetical protein